MDSTLQATQSWSLHLDLLLCFIKLPLAALLLVFISTYTLLARKRKCGRWGRLPPGPTPWPIIGNLLQTGSVPHEGMRRLTQKYGPLVYLKLGCVKAIVTDDPKFVMEFLKKQDHVFASRPVSIASGYFTYGGQDIAFSPYGAHWRTMRRLCLFELLTPKRLEFFKHGKLEEVQCMVKEVLTCSNNNQVINLRDTFGALSSNTLTRMMLGKRYFGPGDAGPADAAEHKALIYAGFAILNSFNIGDYVPLLRPFDLHGHERMMRKIMSRANEIYDAILDEHRQRMDAGPSENHSNFVDQLLSLPGVNGEEKLKQTTIKAILIDMVAAGTDTSSITSEWTMAELLQHPELMEKVSEEIDKVVGKERLVEESDLSSLQQLKATVKEVFRLHPVGAFLIPHVSVQDTYVAGYYIPKETRVLINTFALGRNPEVWESPEEFKPARFLNGDNIVELSDASLRIVPFGAGRRGCPGATLGSGVVLLGLARLIQAFTWSPATKILNLKEEHGLMVLKEPLQAFATPRLSPHLYS